MMLQFCCSTSSRPRNHQLKSSPPVIQKYFQSAELNCCQVIEILSVAAATINFLNILNQLELPLNIVITIWRTEMANHFLESV